MVLFIVEIEVVDQVLRAVSQTRTGNQDNAQSELRDHESAGKLRTSLCNTVLAGQYGDPTTPLPPPSGSGGWPVQPIVPPPYIVVQYPGIGPVIVAPPESSTSP